MIETAIHFLIGFLLAALMAFLAMPAISRRAFRLAERQARMLTPLSAAQATADRDALRGKHAIEVLMNERRYEAAERTAVLAQIELGRYARQIVDLQNEIAEKSADIAQLYEEIEDLGRDLREHNVEIASRELALRDLTHQRDAALSCLADSQIRVDQHQLSLERSRGDVASLEARISELGSALTVQERAFENTASELNSRLAGLTQNLITSRAVAARLDSQVFELEARNTALRTESEGRAAEAVRLRQRLVEVELRLSESERLRDELAVANGRQTTRTSELEAELFRMKTAHREEVERFQDRLSGAVARENEFTMRVQALIAARVDAESAMRAAAAELAGFREKVAIAERIATAAAKGDATLRRSIIRLGRELTDRLPAYSDPVDTPFFPSRGRDELAVSTLGNDDEGASPMVTGG